MTCSIKFVRLNDFIADIDELDLTTNGYSLAVDGYFPTAAPDDAQSVREVITLKLQGTSKDDLAAMTQDIDEKIKQVGWWLKDPGIERYQVWLRVQLENESLPRQAQIISIMPPDKVRIFTPEEKLDNYIGDYQIGIERTPFWEDPYPYPTTTAKTTISDVGGVVQLSETINGDVPARLARLHLYRSDTEAFNYVNHFWLGFRTSRLGGNPANFDPVVDLTVGTAGADASVVGDANTTSGNRLNVSFATTATLATRITNLPLLSVGDWQDYRGNFIALLRARVDSSNTVCRVRMLYGASQYTLVYRSRQIVQDTAYQLYEMGNISFPPIKTKLPLDLAFSDSVIQIQAERISVAGSLYIDCLILIPVTEGAVKIENPVGTVKASGFILWTIAAGIYQNPDNSFTGSIENTTLNLVGGSVAVKPSELQGIPALSEKPYVVIAGTVKDELASSGTNGNRLAGKIDLDYTYIPRWRTLRGNVT